ncbi:MAG TPA: ABC transporter permease [Dehalococcoidia bacterium]|nr:ABC transporter permease [Dehalococcoidia bacterium]
MKTVFRKEMADHFSSIRVFIMFLLTLFISGLALFAAYQGIRGTGSGGFVFLRLFTTQIPDFPFAFLLIFGNFNALFFIPIIGIILGFDSINSEQSGRTLSRILSQPIFRDSVINGKFLASIATLSIMIVISVLLISGFGLRLIGVPPSSEEIIRLFLYLVLAIIYGGFWVGLAMLFSVLFRSTATSILFSLFVWIIFSFGVFIVALAVPAQTSSLLLQFSPNWLFALASGVLMQPQLGAGIVLELVSSTIQPNPLSLGQSLLLVWPHLTLLVSITLICFAISYIVFMKREIRST